MAAMAVVALGALPLAQGAIERSEGAWGRDHGGGRPAEGGCGPAGHRRCLAFTFDDGPDYHTTPRLLAMLQARRMRATFFVVGHRIDGDDPYHAQNRAVLRDIWRAGHLVGNHGYHHVLLDGLRPEALDFEIDRTAALIQQTVGQRPWLLRAPYGAFATARTVDAVYARGYTPVGWTLDTMDWSVTSGEQVVQNFRYVLSAHPHGGVVLLHDTHPWSVSAFPAILHEVDRRNEALRAAGEAPYEVVGLESFFEGTRGATGLR